MTDQRRREEVAAVTKTGSYRELVKPTNQNIYLFPTVVCGLSARWACEINLMDLLNIPSGVSGYLQMRPVIGLDVMTTDAATAR